MDGPGSSEANWGGPPRKALREALQRTEDAKNRLCFFPKEVCD